MSSNERKPRNEEIRLWLETGAKFIAASIAAIAVVAATVIGASYEKKLSSINLLSQRENAESGVRSAMFGSLVRPLIEVSPNQKLDPSRYRVIVELLTLNFHDQFEVKPLLYDADQVLAGIDDVAGRRSLRSVSRRIIDRQITSLSGTAQIAHGKPAKVEEPWFNSIRGADDIAERCSPGNSQSPVMIGGSFCSQSPDGKYHLEIRLDDADFQETTATASITICRATPQCGVGDANYVLGYNFRLTHFDFPLTDNSQIDPQHRFAISLYSYKVEGGPIIVKLVWFPLGFITARERPMNYVLLREALDIDERDDDALNSQAQATE